MMGLCPHCVMAGLGALIIAAPCVKFVLRRAK